MQGCSRGYKVVCAVHLLVFVKEFGIPSVLQSCSVYPLARAYILFFYESTTEYMYRNPLMLTDSTSELWLFMNIKILTISCICDLFICKIFSLDVCFSETIYFSSVNNTYSSISELTKRRALQDIYGQSISE